MIESVIVFDISSLPYLSVSSSHSLQLLFFYFYPLPTSISFHLPSLLSSRSNYQHLSSKSYNQSASAFKTLATNPNMAPLGNLVRLLPLHINELPAHPVLDSLLYNATSNGDSEGGSHSQAGKTESSERPNLISFMEEVLDQATVFVDDTLPATFKETGLKTSKPSVGKVQLLKRMVSPTEVKAVPWINSSIPRNWSANGNKNPGEAWFARRSRHANHSSEGTADLDEFDYGLRHDHSKHEQEYTPDVFDSYEVLNWSEQIETAIGKGPGIDNYKELEMSSKCPQAFPISFSTRTSCA